MSAMRQLPSGLVIPASGLRPEHLGTDSKARGEWRKTNNTIAVAQALHDCKVRSDMTGPELFGALVENVIAAIQGNGPPSQWAEIGDAVCTQIMRRMTQR